MKTVKSIFVAMLLVASVSAVKAQSITNVINGYLEIKNALVATDGSLAAAKSKALLIQIAAVKPDAGQQATWKKYADKITADARQISEVTKVDQQRERFASLSSNIYQLLKATKSNKQALYVQYCPMKKASWLSTKKDIENPYYGEEMLGCGSVKETLAAAK